MVEAARKWSPELQMFKMLISEAACPEVVHSAPTPPSKEAIFFSTISTVGLEMREYICPSTARSNSWPMCSVD